MGIHTRVVPLQFARGDSEIRDVAARRCRGLRRSVGTQRIYRERLDPITRYRRRRHFISRYHLMSECVLWLAENFATHPTCTTHGDKRGHGIPILQKVCLALRHLATGGTYGVIRDSQRGCSSSTVHRCVQEFVSFLFCTAHHYVKFPKKSELQSTAEMFREKFDINDCVGLRSNQEAKACRMGLRVPKKFHALNVMVLYDADGRLTYVDATFAGSQHDQTVSDMSLLGRQIDYTNRLDEFHVLGDSWYALTPQTITPFHNVDYERLTVPQNAFQKKVTSARSFVEHTIGKWKGSWRILSQYGAGVLKAKSAQAGRIVLATAYLHNISLDWDALFLPEFRHDPDYGPVIAQNVTRAFALAQEAVPADCIVLPEPRRPQTMYTSGAMRRAQIIHTDFRGPNPAEDANRARAQRRRCHRQDIAE